MKKYLYYLTITAIFFGISCGGGGGTDFPDTPEQPSRIENPVRENSVPIGVSSFSIGSSGKFPFEDTQTPEGIGYRTVVKAVRHIATSELYTFPEQSNYGQTRNSIRTLINDGHLVTHEIHVLNGPGMRRCTDRWTNGVKGRPVCDDEFDEMVLYDPQMRDALLNLFSEVVLHAQELESYGASVIICPELEDNHSRGTGGSYEELIKLLEQARWSRDKMVRNSVRHFIGDIPGVRSEVHPHNLGQFLGLVPQLRAGDIINTDGNSFAYNTDSNPPSFLIPEEDLRRMVDISQYYGIIFYIWSDRLQGLIQNGPNASMIFDGEYMNRNYVLRKPKELIAILLGLHPDEVKIL